MSRTVTLVLVDAAGTPLGALPPYEVGLPYWQEAGDVVAAARERFGVEVAVLRLLAADRPAPPGGAVTYLAELRSGPRTVLKPPVGRVLPHHPLRAAWARPGGPAASEAWAAAELAGLGHANARLSQERTWNLSAIWRADATNKTSAPIAWLKQVPPFFAHEAAVLAWLGRAIPGAAPTLLAAEPDTAGGCRMLLAHVPGVDWYDAEPAGREAIAEDMHAVHLRSRPELDALLAAGVPDARPEPLVDALSRVAGRHGAGVPGLAGLVEGLPARLAAVAACGLPDVLVHGDLHPGNVRADGRRRVILDWGDCTVGHPAFDILRLADGTDPGARTRLMAGWAARWRRDAPGSDPVRAATLLRPVAALRAAAAYAGFLDGIEPSEHPYHARDVPDCLHRAVAEAAVIGSVAEPARAAGATVFINEHRERR